MKIFDSTSKATGHTRPDMLFMGRVAFEVGFIHSHCYDGNALLVGRFKLFEETSVVLGEHAQVLHLIFQVSDAFHSQTEGVS